MTKLSNFATVLLLVHVVGQLERSSKLERLTNIYWAISLNTKIRWSTCDFLAKKKIDATT